jgi:hypothetical protein
MKKKAKNCELGANCKNTCISRLDTCRVTKENPKVAVAATKIKGDLKPLPKGLHSVAWGRFKIFTTGHEKLAEKADMVLMSKADQLHVSELKKLFPNKEFASADKGIFNFLAQFNKPIPELILGADNKELGDNILKHKLAKKVTYIAREKGAVSSSEARTLFQAGRTPQQMVDLGFFSSLKSAEYGFQRWKDGF